MSDKRLVGRWVFEPTGEVREPQQHEWYQDSIGPMKAIGIKTRPVYPILRVVEQPREVARPSADAVELARTYNPCNNHRCEHGSCRLVRDILEREAAFAEAEKPNETVREVVISKWSSTPAPEPRTLSFQEACELANANPNVWVAERDGSMRIKATDESPYYVFGNCKGQNFGSRVEQKDIAARWTPLVPVPPKPDTPAPSEDAMHIALSQATRHKHHHPQATRHKHHHRLVELSECSNEDCRAAARILAQKEQSNA